MNILQPEEFIVEQLSGLSQLKRVFSVMTIEDFKMKTEITPAVGVFYNGYEVLEHKLASVYRFEAAFVILLAVKSVISPGVVRETAGDLLYTIITTLAGQKPSTDFSALRLVNSYKPIIVPGFGYFPLTFRTTTVIGEI